MNGLKIFTLKRIAKKADSTFGVFLDGDTPFCLTIELAWRDNKPDISCIPVGEYLCQRTVKIKHGECFEILYVPNRSDILIHKGNFTTDTLGCIILGEQFEDILNPKANAVVTSVLSSGKAYSEFMRRLLGQTQFKLVIVEA